ncbi:MAG TPA: formate dehydrogenase accessory sulfurtransferase FdhD [Thermoanaerobaculia bacterium]|nr:formate dehydrogenase accessory sulfurtransferase FdhD [Thermoanaerobaculia bacterium]
MDPVSRTTVTRVDGEKSRSTADDLLAVEEPLEIRIGERPLAVTMRTPGDDFELAAGFAYTENVVAAREDVVSIRHWGSPNVVRITLRDGVKIDWQRLQRHFYAASSCGICGKASIDSIRVHVRPLSASGTVAAEVIRALPDLARAQQKTFDATGAIHAAALFTTSGRLLEVREDIGRHNAVDKVIGAMFLGGMTPAQDHVLFVSGRAGFEVVQKAVVAGIAVIAAVGAPSSLAVDLARQLNVTLVGFLRDGRFNVYCGEDRLKS